MDTLTQEIRALRDQIEALQFKQDLPQLMTPAQCAELPIGRLLTAPTFKKAREYCPSATSRYRNLH